MYHSFVENKNHTGKEIFNSNKKLKSIEYSVLHMLVFSYLVCVDQMTDFCIVNEFICYSINYTFFYQYTELIQFPSALTLLNFPFHVPHHQLGV